MTSSVLRRAALASVAALSLAFSAASPSRAQMTVFDPSNYAQNVLTAARALQQINNQIRQIANQAQSLNNQAKNLTSLPYSIAPNITGEAQRTEQLLAAAQRIAYSVSAVDQAFASQYGDVNLSLSQQQMVAGAQQRWRTSVASLQDALKMQATAVNNLPTARATLTTLGASNQSAAGARKSVE